MADTRPRTIAACDLLQALVDADVIRQGDKVRRVVVDAPIGGHVVVHVERYGDSRLLSVVPTLEGVEVRQERADD